MRWTNIQEKETNDTDMSSCHFVLDGYIDGMKGSIHQSKRWSSTCHQTSIYQPIIKDSTKNKHLLNTDVMQENKDLHKVFKNRFKTPKRLKQKRLMTVKIWKRNQIIIFIFFNSYCLLSNSLILLSNSLLTKKI